MITELDKRTALILIDLQNMIVSLPLAHPVKNVLANANLLLEAFRQNHLPVILVNVDPTGAPWTKTRKDAVPPARTITDEMLQITADIKTNASDLRITKHTWNAFFDTPLHDVLQKERVTGIVLGGVSTSIGVEGTARAASEWGYNIAFATDAMTDMQEEAHTRSIKYIFPRIGELGSTADIIGAVTKLGAFQ